MENSWNAVSRDDEIESSDEEEPPKPPPHTTNGNLKLIDPVSKLVNDENEDLDRNKLSEFKLKHKSLSNLSLNEKLDVFLSKNNGQSHQQLQNQQYLTAGDLDSHLTQLESSKSLQTNSNIHHLSFNLQTQKLDEIENPLNSLSRSGDIELRSGNTSRSSIQSVLKDDERVLPSDNVSKVVHSIALNDGIKGFSDHTVESLIQPPVPTVQHLPKIGSLNREFPDSSNDEFHDSFDQSYNNTEQSIMDLLSKQTGTVGTSSNQHAEVAQLPSSPQISKSINLENLIKQEEDDLVYVKKEEDDGDDFIIKEEPTAIKEENIHIFNIPRLDPMDIGETHNNEDIKQEDDLSMLPNLEVDLEHIHNHPTEIISVSGYASGSASNENMPVRLINPDMKDECIDDEEYDSVHEKSNQFSIRDHIDEDWKFEDSNDGDREDNDEYTNNETHETILRKENDNAEEEDNDEVERVEVNEEERVEENSEVIESSEKELEKDSSLISDTSRVSRSKRLLEIDLSPNVSSEIPPSESVRSLAPPKVESPIKSPIRSKVTPNGSPTKGNIPIVDSLVSATSLASIVAPPPPPPSSYPHPSNTTQSLDEFEENSVPNSLDVPSTVVHTGNHDEEALANSSNIGMHEDITLPPVETNNYSSFEELAKTLDKSMSFEESLSAEHDLDSPQPSGFLNIWHSQDKSKLTQRSNDLLKEYEILQQSMQIPTSLQPKKFKEVNVITRRVISPGFEDLNVSGFLPEISQDSGFGNHFKEIVHDGNSSNTSNSFDTTRESDDILPSESESSSIVKSRLMPPKSTFKPVVKKSQFRVPSFEIKRANSVLSPRNQYNNEIFADTVKSRRVLRQQGAGELGQPPTIKSTGMKTLPSMDRDDVQKILNTKRIISQEEYSKLKLVGNKKKDNLIEPLNRYEHLQQEASLHDAEDDDYFDTDVTPTNQRRIGSDSTTVQRRAESNGSGREVNVDNSILPHLADELLRVPSALLSKDQYFKESEFSSPVRGNAGYSSSEASSRVSSVIHTKKPQTLAPKHVISQQFPDPDPELLHDIFKTPPKELDSTIDSAEDEQAQQRLLNYRAERRDNASSTPIKKTTTRKEHGTPIKIGSPVKLVKTGTNGITAVSSPKRAKEESTFTGYDLNNTKLRESDTTQLQTVNVPSLSSAGTSTTDRKVSHQSLEATITNLSLSNNSKPLSERGRLFLRVVGLKNLDLPDIQTKKALFTMTLDNGVHCIKTPTYALDKKNISIGKEFELTVPEGGLEFILTMKASYEKPKGGLKEIHERRVVKPKNRFSRLIGSKDIITTTKFVPIEVNDSWGNKFAQDGSFARCYVDMEQYEGKITGKVSNFDITCFNEWETVVDSKGEKIKCKPYRIGQLEVKMLFVPRTLAQEILPSSIKSAYESVSLLKYELSMYKEGYMHQEGGDCEIWKRRFFKLHGTALIAHSEFSHKTRAKINLAKVVEVIYIDKENAKTQGNYRNFSDVLLLEHSFKIRFGNGETIDFGAPNKEEKKEWIMIIERIIQRNKFRVQPWVKIMLECNNIQTN